MKILFATLLLLSISTYAVGQGCCSGGSGSPIVGGVSMGVLQQGQIDIGSSFQYAYSNQFYAGTKKTTSPLVKDLVTGYVYSRLGVGITSKFTFYTELGYFSTKKETGFDASRPDYIQKSSGVSDLILFPRYEVYNHSSERSHTEITLGLGLKIPVGRYHDSSIVYIDETTGKEYKVVAPPTVQPTTGSNDFIFYGFAMHEWKPVKLKVFTSMTYIHKGFNGLGEKFGDYAGIGVFTGKSIGKRCNLTGQVRYEWIDKMQVDPNVDYAAKGISLDPLSTGGRKLSVFPQVSYSRKKLTLFGMAEFPLYQNMNGVQIGTKNIVTAGFTYRFMLPKKYLFKEKSLDSGK